MKKKKSQKYIKKINSINKNKRKNKIKNKKSKVSKGNQGSRAGDLNSVLKEKSPCNMKRIKTIEEFFEKLENKNNNQLWKNMSKEQMGGLLMKARDMFKQYYQNKSNSSNS